MTTICGGLILMVPQDIALGVEKSAHFVDSKWIFRCHRWRGLCRAVENGDLPPDDRHLIGPTEGLRCRKTGRTLILQAATPRMSRIKED